MRDQKQLSVVVPVYNNSTTLEELTARILDACQSIDTQIVYVNDRSEDDSLAIIKSLEEKYGREIVTGINFETNQGQQQATLKGLQHAVGLKVAVLDADLQDDPVHIPNLFERLKENRGAVFVKRIGVYQKGIRMLTSSMLKLLVQLISGLNYKAGSYYMVDSETKMVMVRAGTLIKNPYLTIIAAILAPKVDYIPALRNKSQGKSGYSFKKRLKYAGFAIICAIRMNRVKKTLLG